MRYRLQQVPRERTPDFAMRVRLSTTQLELDGDAAPASDGLVDVDVPVTDCRGVPAVGIEVTLGALTAITDEDGVAHFTGVVPGTYPLTMPGAPGAPPTDPVPPAVIVADDLTARAGTLYGRLTDTGDEWLRDQTNSAVGAEVVSTLGATNRTNFITGVFVHPLEPLDVAGYYATVTFLLDAAADFHDKVGLYFNIDPTFTPTTDMSESSTAGGHFRFIGVQLTPTDSPNGNISTAIVGNGSSGQFSDAEIGGPTLIELAPLAAGLHTLKVIGRGTLFTLYVDDVAIFDTDDATLLPHWTTAREIFGNPGVGFGFKQKDTDTVVITNFEAGNLGTDGTEGTLDCAPVETTITVA